MTNKQKRLLGTSLLWLATCFLSITVLILAVFYPDMTDKVILGVSSIVVLIFSFVAWVNRVNLLLISLERDSL